METFRIIHYEFNPLKGYDTVDIECPSFLYDNKIDYHTLIRIKKYNADTNLIEYNYYEEDFESCFITHLNPKDVDFIFKYLDTISLTDRLMIYKT